MDKNILEQFKEWEDVVYDNEESFMKRFCDVKTWTVSYVAWNSERMHLTYIQREGQHICNSFPIAEWLEFYKKEKK